MDRTRTVGTRRNIMVSMDDALLQQAAEAVATAEET